MERELTPTDFETKVRAVVARLAKRADPAALPADVDIFRHLGIASSAALDLLLTLEEELDVHIPDAAFNEARTIAALAELTRACFIPPAPPRRGAHASA